MSKNQKLSAVTCIASLSLLFTIYFAPTPIHAASEVQTTGTGLASRVAPGEFLPLSVKLVNIGGSNKVDVLLTYQIVDAQGNVITSAEETVAVETTASFVRNIQVPANTPPGQYKAESSIVYQVSSGQTTSTSATSEFPFTVERKIFGLFQNDFYLYGGIVLLAAVIAAIVGRLWIRRRRATRLGPIDYSNIPGDTRIFYELISDTVMGMRQQVGEKALEIVRQIKGITIDDRTGRVLTLTEKPSKVIAELVSEYEKVLGKKVSFSLRRPQNKLH